jgi:hypothetical protein
MSITWFPRFFTTVFVIIEINIVIYCIKICICFTSTTGIKSDNTGGELHPEILPRLHLIVTWLSWGIIGVCIRYGNVIEIPFKTIIRWKWTYFRITLGMQFELETAILLLQSLVLYQILVASISSCSICSKVRYIYLSSGFYSNISR